MSSMREAGHVLRETDVDTDALLYGAGPCTSHRGDPGDDGRARRGGSRGRQDHFLRSAWKWLLGTHAGRWNQRRAGHCGGQEGTDWYTKLVRNHLAASALGALRPCELFTGLRACGIWGSGCAASSLVPEVVLRAWPSPSLRRFLVLRRQPFFHGAMISSSPTLARRWESGSGG